MSDEPKVCHVSPMTHFYAIKLSTDGFLRTNNLSGLKLFTDLSEARIWAEEEGGKVVDMFLGEAT